MGFNYHFNTHFNILIMKKSLFILACILSFNSCAAQEAVKPKIAEAPLTVLSVYKGENTATLISRETGHSFLVAATDLVPEWEYYFGLEILECNGCKVKPALIKWYGITARQANLNLAKKKADFENPKLN